MYLKYSTMEKSSCLKQNSRNMKQIHEFKVKGSSWDQFSSNEADLVGAGFSWPPRSYICSFCKREFRSAQALGGHMNVHRRDRARLRQSPTRSDGGKLNLNLEPKPNPSFNSSSNPSNFQSPTLSSLLTSFPHFTSKFPPLGAETIKPKAAKALFGTWVNNEKEDLVRLDLEIGVISAADSSKEELDLELRLGYT